MATRQRKQAQDSGVHEHENDTFAYEALFGLDDDITEDDVEAFLEEQALAEELKGRKGGFLNLQTGAGLAIIAIGTIYLLQQLGFFALPFSMGAFVALLPWLAGILIILTGFGVLSWSPSRRRRRARRKARARRAQMERARAKSMGRASTEERSRANQQARQSARRAAREAERESRSASKSDRRAKTRKRLAKSRHDKVLLGVAGGIADFLGVEPWIVRVAFVIGTIVGSGFTVPLYLILAFVLPAASELLAEDDDDDDYVRVVQD